MKIDPFQILSAEEFNRLPQAEKMEYLRQAVAALNEQSAIALRSLVEDSAHAFEPTQH